MSGNESVGLPAGQSWGSTPLSLLASQPEAGTVWALDKGLLREGMTEAKFTVDLLSTTRGQHH